MEFHKQEEDKDKMKSALPLLILGAAALLYSQNSKPVKKSTPKKDTSEEDTSEYPDFPDEIDKKINEENIYKYYSKNPLYLNTVPAIFNDFDDIYKSYYDPKGQSGNENAYLLITPAFAEQAWNYAKVLMINQPNIYSGKNAKEADLVTREILMKFSPDVYWKEGLTPYAWATPFAYVYASVSYLVRLAYAVINGLPIDHAPGSFEL